VREIGNGEGRNHGPEPEASAEKEVLERFEGFAPLEGE